MCYGKEKQSKDDISEVKADEFAKKHGVFSKRAVKPKEKIQGKEEFIQEERKESDEIATNNYNHKSDKTHGSIF